MSKFEIELKKNLIEKKKVAESTANLYLKNLQKLNGSNEIKNLDFLNDRKAILEFTADYAENTQRNFLIAVNSVLNMYPKYKKIYKTYFEDLKNINKKLKENESKNEKSESQIKNWVDWSDVLKIHEDLKKDISTFVKNKKLTQTEYLKLLKYMVLSLYVLQPPRRNKDYISLINKNGTLNKTDNFLNLNLDEFELNNFKTKKTEGNLNISIPEDLMTVIMQYLNHHPLIEPKDLKNKKGVINQVPFLVFQNGDPINKQNGITYILNNIFGKSTGSSILRHSYLTHKYGDVAKEQEKDAALMSHSLAQAKDYVKKD
jgi:hypothetical protein